MVSFPPCKINLGLNILRKRMDGYHDLETCFYPLPLTDILEIIPSDSFSFTSTGTTIPGDSGSNLCVKAYQLLREKYDLPPVKIHLHKIIPTGAGLGGGSADGAHTLRILNEVFSLNLDQQNLASYAARLGSDCAFFIYDTAMIGQGRGEILSQCQVTLKGKYVVLINPGVHVSTAVAYSEVIPREREASLEKELTLGIDHWQHKVTNDFERSVFQKFPEIAKLKSVLYAAGAEYAAMSGSGSSVYGIFGDKKDLPEHLSSMILWQGFLP